MQHFIFHFVIYQSIREQYIPKYLEMNSNVLSISDDEDLLLISILDPLSSKLPDIVSRNWSSVHDVYKLSRKLIYRMHLKREKIYTKIDEKS